jgi:hypothetical protein
MNLWIHLGWSSFGLGSQAVSFLINLHLTTAGSVRPYRVSHSEISATLSFVVESARIPRWFSSSTSPSASTSSVASVLSNTIPKLSNSHELFRNEESGGQMHWHRKGRTVLLREEPSPI